MNHIQNQYQKRIAKTDNRAVIILIIGLISLLTPWLLTAFEAPFKDLDFSSTGQIGDTIGGITAPFLSLVGSVLVFLSFRAQIEMNRVQFSAIQKQFEKIDKEEDEKSINRMQHVLNVIRDQYLEQYELFFNKHSKESMAYFALTRINLFPNKETKENLKLNVLNKIQNSLLLFSPLFYLKKLIEESDLEEVEIDFIKIQARLILENYGMIKVVDEIKSRLQEAKSYEENMTVISRIEDLDMELNEFYNLDYVCRSFKFSSEENGDEWIPE
ncbi:hypothetical protein [Marinilabilia sp.]|uniref:hypothetical protein n=1 Tax=Marinilabilia sp. TaxID=2021252 RepID=UPI0025C68B6F|nr:hypothetical protein [Marinilabilia sp.]